MPSPDPNATPGTASPPATRFPAAVDPDARYAAVVSRGRTIRRRRLAGRGGALLGASALAAVAVFAFVQPGDPPTTVVSEAERNLPAAESRSRTATTVDVPPPTTLPTTGCTPPDPTCEVAVAAASAAAPEGTEVSGQALSGGAEAPASAPPPVPETPVPPTSLAFSDSDQMPPPTNTLVIGDLVDGAIRITDPQVPDTGEPGESICVNLNIDYPRLPLAQTVSTGGCSSSPDGGDLLLQPWDASMRVWGLMATTGPVSRRLSIDTTLRITDDWVAVARDAGVALQPGDVVTLTVSANSGDPAHPSSNSAGRSFTLTVPSPTPPGAPAP
jgi:hypothetical protein